MDRILSKLVLRSENMRVVIINTVNGKFRFEERSVKNFSEFNNVELVLCQYFGHKKSNFFMLETIDKFV